MDFKQFRYFIAVADELHVGRAAEKIGIAQPALSQQIKQLELQLKTQLFRREKRGISLTDAGEQFLVHARVALEHADIAMEIGRLTAAGEAGRIRFGYVDSVSASPIWRRVLAEFRATHPNVDIFLVRAAPSSLLRELELGLLDIVTARPPMVKVPRAIQTEIMARERLMVALPAHHRLAHLDEIPLESLAHENLTTTAASGTGLPTQIEQMFADADVPVTLSRRSPIAMTVTQLVGSGFGIAIVPECFASIKVEGVVLRPLATKITTDIHLYSRVREQQPATCAFLRSFRKMLSAGNRHVDAPAWAVA